MSAKKKLAKPTTRGKPLDFCLDTQGYPTPNTLKIIQCWPSNDGHELMNFVKSVWEYGDDCFSIYDVPTDNAIAYRLVTGGWSGNEDLIKALQRNVVFWTMFWESSHRGGVFIFKIPK